MEPPALRSLLRRVLAAAEPLRGLRALTELRGELAEIETELVADALRRGYSWSQVGEALAISKQAAHRRHRHGVSELDKAVETGRRGRRLAVSPSVRRAVRMARVEASARGQQTVGTEDLLLGLLRSGDAESVSLLAARGVTVELVREAAQPTAELSPEVAARLADTQATGNGAANTVLSPLARAVLERALFERSRHARDPAPAADAPRPQPLSGLDLLAALLRVSDGGAARTLQALGVDSGELRAELAALASPSIRWGHDGPQSPVPPSRAPGRRGQIV